MTRASAEVSFSPLRFSTNLRTRPLNLGTNAQSGSGANHLAEAIAGGYEVNFDLTTGTPYVGSASRVRNVSSMTDTTSSLIPTKKSAFSLPSFHRIRLSVRRKKESLT